jgi:hypothetical protein
MTCKLFKFCIKFTEIEFRGLNDFKFLLIEIVFLLNRIWSKLLLIVIYHAFAWSHGFK